MNFIEVFLNFLVIVMGSQSVPENELGMWSAGNKWERTSEYLFFEARSEKVVEACKSKKDLYIVTPFLVQGGHQLWLDDILVESSFDGTFKEAASFYNYAYLPCEKVANSKILKWIAYTKTSTSAHLGFFPKLTKNVLVIKFFSELLNLILAGSLLIISLTTYLIFRGKIDKNILSSFIVASLFFSFCFLMFIPNYFLLKIDPVARQKISDSCLWLGAIFISNYFCNLGFIQNITHKINATLCLIGLIIIVFSTNIDQVQVGSNIAFIGVLAFLVGTLAFVSKFLFSQSISSENILKFLTIFLFAAAGLNDVFVFHGVIDFYPMFPLGVLLSFILSSIVINEKIKFTYRERDYLRANLEKEVERKTNELKVAQAELVQSAKLASLGTLSAGLAHEINNAVNYVNGALVPLEKLVGSSITEDSKKTKIDKLFVVMKDGLNLTVEIIKSLRNYTGLNQANFNDLSVAEVVNSVCTILKNKLRDKIKLEIKVPNDHFVFGSVVGLNQVFMNIISNAADAMGESGGVLSIQSDSIGDAIKIEITDTGPGIPDSIKDRIFDPFFTTKGVGKGTGLGLFIVKKEIDKHYGSISVNSEVDKGTTFSIILPIRDRGIEGKVA